MIVVTGAAGFIGSCIVAKLNENHIKDLILVDHLSEEKKANLEQKSYKSYFDKTDFLELVKSNKLDSSIECIIHMGACSSTTLQDAQYFKENNLEYTISLAQWALEHNVRFIYASSAATYGDGSIGYKDDVPTIKKCKPLNLYGQSKQDFDLWVLENNVLDQVVGLKFFNVFGPNEYHKADMRSVVSKAYKGVAQEGEISLFKSYHPDYQDGEQKRDFVYVKDAVDAVLFFMEKKTANGIFNLGTGQAHSWNDLAKSLFKATKKDLNIKYIKMPGILKDKYQYFTEADISNLRSVGFKKPFMSLDDSVADYVGFLKEHKYW